MIAGLFFTGGNSTSDPNRDATAPTGPAAVFIRSGGSKTGIAYGSTTQLRK
jgi:hypothetical protein